MHSCGALTDDILARARARGCLVPCCYGQLQRVHQDLGGGPRSGRRRRGRGRRRRGGGAGAGGAAGGERGDARGEGGGAAPAAPPLSAEEFATIARGADAAVPAARRGVVRPSRARTEPLTVGHVKTSR